MPNIFGLILTCVIVVIVFSLLLFLIKRYKKCPSDKVMVIYGKVGSRPAGYSGASLVKERIRWKACGKFCRSNSASNWSSSPPRSEKDMGAVSRWLKTRPPARFPSSRSTQMRSTPF